MSSKGYWALPLSGPSEALEAALPSLVEAGCLGTSESDGGPQLAYFPGGTDLDSVLLALSSHPALKAAPPERFADRDWLEAWRADLKGFPLGARFYMQPTWEPPFDTDRIVLRIDPERAFGTGTHETTRLCVELLEKHLLPDWHAIDVGAGTAILAIAAAHLGCRSVTAVEVDPDAAQCAITNVRRNRVSDRVTVLCASIEETSLPPVELVVANLTAAFLARELDRLAGLLLPRGILILGGILLGQADDVEASAGSLLSLVEQKEMGEWVSLAYRKA